MGITSAMWTGISGLNAHSEATSVVSNNLANVSTTGYKSQSTNFEDVFYSTLATGSGTDQVGHGATIASVTTDFTQGSYEETGITTNLAIGGDGYFMVEDPNSDTMYYTRAGNFDLDSDGYLVDPHGNCVQGWAMDDGSISGAVTDIQMSQDQSPPSATSEITATLNLDSEDISQANASGAGTYFASFSSYDGTQETALDSSFYSYSTVVTVYDENGSSHDLTMYLDPVDTDAEGNIVWEYNIASSADEDLRTIDGVEIGDTSAAGLLMTGTLTFKSTGEISSMTAYTLSEPLSNTTDIMDPANWTLSDFNDSGQPTVSANFTGAAEAQTIGIDFGLTNEMPQNGWTNTAGLTSLDNYTAATSYDELPSFADPSRTADATTSYAISSATYGTNQDGYGPGTLMNLTVDQSGVISGQYSNGQIVELYTVALANFNSPSGLYATGSNLYMETQSSGQPLIGQAGTSSFGDIASSTLEGSNVDMATEMANLIVLQSAYSANSKVVTTANTMLQTAINMKS